MNMECGQIDRFLFFGPLPGLPCRTPFQEEHRASLVGAGCWRGIELCVYWRPVQLYMWMASLGSAKLTSPRTPPHMAKAKESRVVTATLGVIPCNGPAEDDVRGKRWPAGIGYICSD